MKTKITFILLLLLFVMGGGVFAQVQINAPTSYQPVSLNQGGAPSTYKVDIVNNNPSALTDATFSLALPAGMEYIAGTITGATQLSIGNLQSPTFTLNSIPVGNTLTITFDARINCGYSAQTINYSVSSLGTTIATGLSPVAGNTPAPAYVLPIVPQPQILNTTLNTNATRTIKFINSGVLPVTTVYIESTVATDSQAPSYKVINADNGTLSPITNGYRITLTGAALQNAITKTVGAANPSFDGGEEITVVLTEQILSCATGSSIALNMKVGSGDIKGSLCFYDSSTASISTAVGNPAISLTRLTGTTYPDFCNNGKVSYIIKNEGTGVSSSLYDIKLPWSVNYLGSGIAPNIEPASTIIIKKVSINGNDITDLVLTRNGTGSNVLVPGLENGFIINLAGLASAYGTDLQSLNNDGKYDDLLAGHSFQLDFEYAFNTSSFKTCVLNSYSMPNNGWDYFSLGTSFIDQCGTRTNKTNYSSGSITNYTASTFQVGSQQNAAFTASLSASSLYDGDKITLNTTFGGALVGAYAQGGKIIKTFTIILPDGLEYDSSRNIIWQTSPGSIIPTDAISYNAGTKTLVLTPSSTFEGIDNNNDLFQIPLIVTDNTVITNKTVQYSSTFGFTGCGVTMPYGCSSQRLNYAIIKEGCPTVKTTSFDMTRATFGYVPASSNTNVWYMPTDYVNENTIGINLHGAVSKDKVKTTFKGIVNSTNFAELWARVKYISQDSSNFTLSNFDSLSSNPGDIAGTITITKASDGSTLSSNITVDDIVFSYDAGTTSQLQQVNLGAKIGEGKAINYTLQVGDQITVNWMTKVSRDNLSYTYSQLQNLEGDLYTKDNVGISSDCQALPLVFSIQKLYFASNNFSGIQAIVGKNGMRIDSSIMNGSESKDALGDHFPNEVRNYGVFRSMKTTIPGIWIMDSTVGKEPYYSTSYNADSYKIDPSLFSITYNGGNTILTFNNTGLGSNGMPLSSANLPVVADWSGAGGNTNISVFLMPVCATEGEFSPAVNQTYDIYTTERDNSNTESVQQAYDAENYTVYNYKANALPTLQNVDGIGSTVNWQVSVTNTSDTAAITAAGGSADLPNSWMSFVSPNNNIIVTKVTNIGTGIVYPVINYSTGKYWIKIGNIAATETFNVESHYTACSDDKLQYTYSFSTTGYPIDPDQGFGADVSSCEASQTKFDLNLFPKDVNLSMTVNSPLNPVQFCTNETAVENKIDYTVNVANTAVGNAEGLILEATFPAGYGARSGTSTFTYNGITKTLKDPVYNSTRDTWEWNISTDPNGVSFLPSAAAGANSFILEYRGETQCGFISGSAVRYNMRSTSGCGKVIEYAANGTAMELSMKPSIFNTYYLAPSVVNLKNDGNGSSYQIEVTNQGSQPLSPGESIYVNMPKSLDYVAGSVVRLNGATNINEPLSNTIVGNNRILHFPLPTGAIDTSTLLQNEKATFSIDLKIVDAQPLNCGTTSEAIVLNAIYAVPGVTCGSAPCDVSMITGTAKSDINVTKTAFTISPISGIAKYATSTNNDVTIKYTVTNAGTIANNTPIVVDFFNDLNKDGLYNGTEPILYTQTITGGDQNLSQGAVSPEQTTASFTAPESGICNIAAVIRLVNNTEVCEDSSAKTPVEFESAVTSFNVCAGSNVTIGNPSNGATVSWSPSMYLSDATASNPVFNYNGTTLTVPTDFTYTATITHSGGCTDKYTNTVTVNPLPVSTIAYPNSSYCNRGTAAVTLTGVTGGTFTGDTGLVINSTTGEIDLTASTTGNHDVTYSFTNSTCQNTTTTIIRINATTLPGTLSNITRQCSVTPAAPTITDYCAGTITATTTTVFPITTQGTTVVTWTFNYGNGFTKTATQNVIIKDVTAPDIPQLTDITAECKVDSITAPTTTDNCAGTVTGTTAASFPITTQGTTIVTWTFDDGNGNSVTADQNVIIRDNTAPVKPTLEDVTAECKVDSITAPTTTDNCAGTVTGTTAASFPITTQGTTIVTWTFDDGNGNSVTADQNVIIRDNTAPVKPTLEDVTAQCKVDSITAPTTTDNCAGTVTGTTAASFPITTQGTTIVTWTFDDGNGNTVTADQNVIIRDNNAPVKPTLADVTAQCKVDSITAPTTTDNCAGTVTGTTAASFPITTQGTTIVTWTFDDGNGNSVTADQNVIIRDNTAPVKPTLEDVTAECKVDSITAPTTTDNCAGTVTGTTAASFPITTQGTTIVTWTFDDGNGNSVTADQNVIIRDNTAPVKPTLADVTAECKVDSITAPTTTDNCAGTVTGTTEASFPITTQGTTIVTWTFDDGNGNSVTADQNVIIRDNTAPVKPTLEDVTAECKVDSITAPTTTDNCAGTVTGTTAASFPITTQGTTIVTWTFDDGNGNTVTADQNVIIRDNTAPVKPTLADVTAQCEVDSITAPTTTDNCAGMVTGTTAASFPITTQGTTVVTWTFDDGNGNTTTAEQKVIIDNTIPPVVPTLEDVTAECSVSSIPAPITTGNCSGSVTGTTAASFPITTQGTTIVTWTFDDGNGNSVTADQNVIIRDNTAPVKPTLEDVTAECKVDSITAPTTTDNCAGTVTGTTAASFPITTQGTTIVTWTFDDGNGNTTTAEQNVIIRDNTAPVKPTLEDVTAECRVDSITAPTTTDNCAGTVTGTTAASFPITTQGTTIVTWTFDDGNGNTVTADQNVIIRDNTAPVKPTLEDVTAECKVDSITAPTTTDNCAGTVTGTTAASFPITTQGTTIVTWTFDDGNGNSVTADQNVIIRDNTAPVKPTLADVTAECKVDSITAPTTTDNCAGTVTGTTEASFPITTQGTTIVTWTFDDGNGNSVTADQNVIIRDNTAPVKPTLADVTAECKVDSITAPTTTDNCAGTVTGTTEASFPITTQGTTIVTWTFDDGNGNSVTADQNVIIRDNTAPVKPTLEDVTAECKVDSITAPTTTDNCAGTVTGTTAASFPITTQGTTIVTWTFDDGNGNTTTAEQNVIIMDNNAPVKPTLADIIGQCNVTPDAPTTTDNCAGTITGTTTTPFPITAEGTTVVTWRFDDGNGNSVTADQNVIIGNVALSATESTLCAVDGTGYVLSFSVTGQAPYAVTGTGAPGTWNGNEWTSDKILAGTDYNVSVQDAYACNTIIVKNTAPICCAYEVKAPTFAPTAATCYDQIPTAATLTKAEYEALGNGDGKIGDIPCGVIQITASNSADPGCNGNVIRTYTVTEYADPNNNKVRDAGENTVLNTTSSEQLFALERADFAMPANGAKTVDCSSAVVAPAVPEVKDNCGNVLAASAPVVSAMPTCNGTVTYTYTFTDCAGHKHDWAYTYTIDNTMAPKGTAPADITVQCIDDIPAANVNAVTNVVGNCNNSVTVTIADSNNGGSGCVSDPYIVTRTYTLTDCGGLTAKLVQTITVKDTTPPVFDQTLPPNLTLECTDAIPPAVTLTATDNCSTATVISNEVRVNGSCPGSYQLQRTWIAADACGNETKHTQIINVADTTAPVFVETLPAAEINASCDAIPEEVTLTAIDECSNAHVIYKEEKIDGSCNGRYTLVRTWTAIDDCSNQTSFTQTINVSCLEVFNGLSPNGDGINDTFKIGGIDCFPNNTVRIYNRYGVMVYEKKGYDNVTNPFAGLSDGRTTVIKGDKLPTGTYFYTLEYDDNGKQVQKSAYIYISTN